MNPTIRQIEHEAKFKALRLEPVPILGTPFTIRLPASFFASGGAVYTLESQNPITGDYPIPPEMLQPPFMTIPGVKSLYQGAAQDERGVRLPYFCYVATIEHGQEQAEPAAPATPPAEGNAPAEENKPAEEQKPAEEEKKAEGEGENKPEDEKPSDQPPAARPKPKPVPLDARLAAEVTQAFGGKTPIQWETIECETPQDPSVKIPWRRLVAEGEQEFRYLNSDVLNKLPGRFELYMFQSPDQAFTVILAWRVADSIRGKVPLDDWAMRAAGTIKGF